MQQYFVNSWKHSQPKEEREAELKETYTKKSIEAASLDNLKAELASNRSSFDILLKQLPTDAEIPTLI